MDQILFYLFAVVAFASAVLAVTRRNAVSAAVWLVGMFFGLAGTFVLLEAYFVAVIQILVYAGAIMVLFLFVIMLLDLRREDLITGRGPRLRLPGILLSALFLGAIAHAILDAGGGDAVAPRATALLRLPPRLPASSADPLAASTAFETPAPSVVPLAPRDPRSLPIDDALRTHLATRFAANPDAPTPGGPSLLQRVFFGTVVVGERRRDVLVALVRRREGDALVWVPEAFGDLDGDGRVSDRERLAPAIASDASPRDPGLDLSDLNPARAGARAFEISPIHPFASLDVSVHQGGLAAAPGGAPDGSPFAIGKSLFDDWILPFEVTSVLLLGAIFGAVVLTKRRLA